MAHNSLRNPASGMVGAPGAFSCIDMGGMFTSLKIRDEFAIRNGDPNRYRHPPGTVASLASCDGIA